MLNIPAQWSELACAAPWVVGEGEVGDGAEIKSFGKRLQPVVVQVQRLDRRHASKSTITELEKGESQILVLFFGGKSGGCIYLAPLSKAP